MKTRKQNLRGIFAAAKLSLGSLARIAAATLAFLCAGEAWGQSAAPINPAFVQWQKKRELKVPRTSAQTNSVSKPKLRRAASDNSDSGGEYEPAFGLAPDVFDTSYLSSLNVDVQRGVQDSIPSFYDLREKGGVLSPIRNQGYYGTCWAHATCASLESGIRAVGNGSFDFSEKNLAMLHGGDWSFDDGGNANLSSAYLLRWGGPVLEGDDVYPDDSYYLGWFYDNYEWNGTLEKWIFLDKYELDSILPESPQLPPEFHVQNIKWIPGRTSYLDNDGIKTAISENGALYVSYYHDDKYLNSASFYNYEDRRNSNGSRKTNHAVTVVGWDDDYPAGNFAKSPSGNGAFIVRNSWGTSFGDGGYFYVSYYDESFAWGTLYAFFNAEPADNYDAVYQYDPLGIVSSVGYGSSTAWGANIFTATNATQVSAVGFYALTPNTSYTIKIYLSPTSTDNPASGTLATTQSGKLESAGFFTVPLQTPQSVLARQRFSVVVQLTTPGRNYPLAYEYAEWGYSSEATASSGQSFMSHDGTKWSDFTKWNGSANFCCKAYTKSATAAKPKLASIAITPENGAASLAPGDRVQLKCEATYDNNVKSNVTAAAQWSLTTGQNYATISSSGMLTGKNVAVLEPQTITVQSIYSEDGISATNRFGFSMAATPPEPPTGVSATQGTETSCVRVNWTAPNGATEYAVYRAVANNSKNAQYLDRVTVAKYNDTSATPGVDYWYFVKAKNSSGASDFSAVAHGWRALAAPADVVASDGTSAESVSVSWTSAEGASAYRVYRAGSFDGEYEAKTGWISTAEWADTSAEQGVTYWYSVVAAVDSAGNRPSDYSVPDDGFRAVPVVPSSLVIEGAASIASGGQATYSAYVEFSDGHCGDTPVSPTWSVSAGSVSRTGAVTVPVVSANTDITLSASTTVEGVHVAGTKAILVTATVPAAPVGLRVVSATAAEGVALAWDAVPGASGYRVFRTADGANETSFASSTASFTDTTATPGVLYAYAVATENAAGTGTRSAAIEVRLPLAAPQGVSATKDRTDYVRVAWAAVAGATHYRVARAASVSSAKTDLGSSWTAALSFDDTTAVAGTTYTYFVRAATSAAGANAGGYSVGVEGRRKPSQTHVSLSITGPDRVPASGEAVYSCTAVWSDGTAETVSPSWSVSPASAGTIDADGRFVAAAVETDVAATIGAAFGGFSFALRSVTVVAPAEATAEIIAVSAAQRWPFSGLVDIDYTLATAPAGTKASISVSGHDADHGRPVAATTLSGDGASGPVDAGTHRLTWNLAADHPGFHAKALNISLEAVPAKRVTVTFDGNGGTPATSSISGVVGDAYGTLPTATRTGYAFAGWFTAATGGTHVTETSRFDENVTTLYANWTANRYTVTLDRQSGTGGTTSVTATYGEALPSITVPTRTGYTFGGYYTSTGGSGTQYYTASGTSARTWDKTAALTLYAKWTVEKVQLWEDGPYWAATNIGAEKPEDFGLYFWWGDTVGYKRENNAWVASNGFSQNFSFSSGNTPTIDKSDATLESEGWIVFKDGTYYVLAPKHDAAQAHWGGSWRMPTYQELYDLCHDKCDWTWTTRNGVKGYVVRGRGEFAGASIFLPAAGYGYGTSLDGAGSSDYYLGYYWSSVPSSYVTLSYSTSWNLFFNSDSYSEASGNSRYYGQVVRPVQDPAVTVTVTLDRQSGTGGTTSVTATYGAALPAITVPTRTGYTFCGYYTSTGGSGTQYYTASGTSVRIWDKTAVTTLYAKWTAEEHDKVQLWEGGPYWATTNIGAEKPEDFGLYFWWGDTVGYRRENDAWVASDGSSQNFSFSPGNTPTHEKSNATLQSGGWWITADCVLTPAHDAAQAHWGGSWRMPTDSEFSALKSNCDWTWSTTNGVNGYVVRGRGDYASASIFLPAAGYGGGTSLSYAGSNGYYWSSVPSASDSHSRAWYLSFYSGGHDVYNYARSCGGVERPVQDAPAGTVIVTLDRQSGTGGTASVTATYGSAMPAITVPTRTGYTFGGYYTSTGGSGAQYYTASGTSARIWDKTAATTLYAKWTANADSHGKVQLWEGGPYWATTNIGAERPEDYGLYFWWGDTVGYRREGDAWVPNDGSSQNFSFSTNNTPTYKKSIDTLQSEGWITTDGVLAPEHDAAHVHLGGAWRMPTEDEILSLRINCDWTLTTQNGVSGYVVRGRGDYTSASIFLPAAGRGLGTSLYDAGSRGNYWSSVPNASYSDYAWGLYFYSGGPDVLDSRRDLGRVVRPVQGFAE